MSTEPTIKEGYKTTVHRDGSVSFWNVLLQMWQRLPAAFVPNEVLATMTDRERASIRRAAYAK